MRVETAGAAAAGVALALFLALTGCRSGPGPAEAPHAEEEERTDPGTDAVPAGFVRGGAAGLARARKEGRGAMLLFAATW